MHFSRRPNYSGSLGEVSGGVELSNGEDVNGTSTAILAKDSTKQIDILIIDLFALLVAPTILHGNQSCNENSSKLGRMQWIPMVVRNTVGLGRVQWIRRICH